MYICKILRQSHITPLSNYRLVLTLSKFSSLDIDHFCLGNRPRRLWFISKKSFETNKLLYCKYIALAVQFKLKKTLTGKWVVQMTTIAWENNETIERYCAIRLCSSAGLLHLSQITSISIAQTNITQRPCGFKAAWRQLFDTLVALFVCNSQRSISARRKWSREMFHKFRTS